MEVALLDSSRNSVDESEVAAYVEAGLFIIAGLLWVSFWKHYNSNVCGDHTYCVVTMYWSAAFVAFGIVAALIRDFFIAESTELED